MTDMAPSPLHVTSNSTPPVSTEVSIFRPDMPYGTGLPDCTVNYDDATSSCSSDDSEEEGVFLGTRTDAESRFLAQLSKPSETPSPPKAVTKCRRRQSRLVSRLRKDSTEFHRRATMVFPIAEHQDEDDDGDDRLLDGMMQERYQREVSVLQISPSVLASARKHSPRRSLSLLCSSYDSLQCSDTDSSDGDDSSELSTISTTTEQSVDVTHPDSDKENERVPEDVEREDRMSQAPLSSLAGCTDIQAEGVDQTPDTFLAGYGHAISVEQGWATGQVLGLDLGGLSLNDFGDADPEEDTEVLDSLAGLAIMYTSEDEAAADHPPRIASPSPVVGQSTDPSLKLSTASPLDSSLDEALNGVGFAEAKAFGEEAMTASESDEALDGSKSLDISQGSPEVLEDDSDLDPLPVPRANPSMTALAHFSPIRASASPFRSPPNMLAFTSVPSPPPQPLFAPTARDDETLLSPSQTPTRPPPQETPLTAKTPRQLGPLPTTAATPCQTREGVVPLADRTTKIIKSHTIASQAPKVTEPVLVPAKDKSRALAVRGQLDAVFTSRTGKMGPPQRTTSASSSQSSSSSSGRQPSRLDLEKAARKAPTTIKPVPIRPGSGLSRPQPSTTLAKAVSATGLPASKRPNPSLSTSLARPSAATAKSTGPPARLALAPRSLVAHPAKQPVIKSVPSKLSRPVEHSSQPVTAERPAVVASSTSANPLKRPFPSGGFALPARQAVPVASGSRPGLGLPSRLVWDASQGRHAQTFHVGAAPENTMARIAARSPARQGSYQRPPGTPSTSRALKLGTPSRADGTPRTIRAKPSFQTLAAPAPKHDVAEIPVATTDGPPAAATRQASEQRENSLQAVNDQHRGSSEDHEDVSMLLPDAPSSSQSTASSSPQKKSEASPKQPSPPTNDADSGNSSKEEKSGSSSSQDLRPKRSTRPPVSRGRSMSNAPPAPWMSGKELKTTTDRNTMRNQVYLCAIDRQIVRKNGPRPPSPTSKIRTTADRDEEEKKKSREHRAKRRARDSDNTAAGDSPEQPRIEKVERLRGPGDDEDWRTPARPAKKAKIGVDKSVKWDKGLVIIRDDGTGVCPPASAEAEEPARSSIRQEARVQLDKHGNLVTSTRPSENLKRSKVVVTAVFYDGEEPVPVPEFPTVQDASGTSGRGKKKK